MGVTVQIKKIVLVDDQNYEGGTGVLEQNFLLFNFKSEGKMDYVIPWSQVKFIELQ